MQEFWSDIFLSVFKKITEIIKNGLCIQITFFEHPYENEIEFYQEAEKHLQETRVNPPPFPFLTMSFIVSVQNKDIL